VKKIFILLFLIHTSCGFSKTIQVPNIDINILSWWGYLDSKLVTEVKQECGVNVSFDEYYSNEEFLRRWQSQSEYYDIIIFSRTMYNIIKNKLPNIPQSTLWKKSLLYHPIIKKHYQIAHYPHNVAYFVHSISGFLYNPENISLSPNDSVEDIFKKAKDNYAVILDDSIEVNTLVKNFHIQNNNPLTIPTFKNVTQNANIYILNNYSRIYKNKKFAFSFGWSGEAVVDILESNKQYQFLIHPKLSYISSDLIAQTSNNKQALCVAKFLIGEKATHELTNKDFYFSSYKNYLRPTNTTFAKIYENFINSLALLPWTDSIDEKYFAKTNREWQLIKLSLNNHIQVRKSNENFN